MSEMKEDRDIYDIIFSSPGIDDEVKLGCKISCRASLFIAIALDYCMSSADKTNPLRDILSGKDQEMLAGFLSELLQRSRLVDFYGKLKKRSMVGK